MSKQEKFKMQTVSQETKPQDREISYLDAHGVDSAIIKIHMVSNKHLDKAIEKLTELVEELKKIKRYRLNRSYAMMLSIRSIQDTSQYLKPPTKEHRTPQRGRGYPIKYSWEDE